ncbi:hypothetical protein H6G54_20860 [Anabaena cylindrica FACHB-243]|nr:MULTISPECIES: hypothetical protein [Anabaena]MBD2420108.1 hypothetical protein [Anabaena cylindrica FACHB-243]MBY5285379.1 hypothetical protein [Anabaena sp. CCAP 1446/1C]MBY5306580.1 hypothetical protein [Anabaena sp. CCAP 1446/1C]MCM2406995.1 hypothetical protein [Anabaena sp. CCAP 1446/1C]
MKFHSHELPQATRTDLDFCFLPESAPVSAKIPQAVPGKIPQTIPQPV